MHDTENVLSVLLFESTLAGQRIDAVIGDGCSHQRQITRAHQDRALLKIEVEVLVDRLIDHAEV